MPSAVLARPAPVASVTTSTPSAHQHARHQVTRLGLLAAQRRLGAHHEGHRHAETLHGLGELDGDRPAADDAERARQVGQAQQRVAGQVRHRGRAGDRRRAGAAPTASTVGTPSRPASLPSSSRRSPLKRRLRRHEQDAVVVRDQVLVEPPAVVDHAVDSAHHGRAVDAHVGLDAELGAAAGEVRDLRGPDQGLRRDAPDVDSGAAERLGLDQQHARAETTRPHRRRDAAHPAADDHEVGSELLRIHRRVAYATTMRRHSVATDWIGPIPAARLAGLLAAVRRLLGVQPQLRGIARPVRRRPRGGARERPAGHRRRAAARPVLRARPAALGAARRARASCSSIANWTYFNCQFTISFGFLLWVYFRRNYAFYFVAQRDPLRRLHRAHRLPRRSRRRRRACTRSSASSTRSRARRSATRRASSRPSRTRTRRCRACTPPTR